MTARPSAPASGPLAFTVTWHDALGSTMDEMRARARDGAAHGSVVCARRQSAGRGRVGRPWVSPEGNLYASLLLRGEEVAQLATEIAFVAALAVADATESFLPAKPAPRLKWPNDVLLDGAKLSGILLERLAPEGDAGAALVVGIGINVAHAPEGLPYPATCLQRHAGRPLAVPAVLEALLAAFRAWFARWSAEGFAPVRQAWLRRGHAPGEELRVTLGDRREAGQFAGLAEDGALLLRTPAGERRFVAGEVMRTAAAREDTERRG